jgi:glycerol-3-phosphate acyltransferase PlsY
MTDQVLMVVIALIAAYFLGAIPSGYLMGRLRKGIDIRQVGSHSMGAMNVFYQVGLTEGLIVLFLDIGKGAAAVALARWLDLPLIIQMVAGATAVVGHAFTVFLRFRGGRGGATCIGILAYLIPWGIPAYAAVFGLALLLTRYPTLSYSLAFLAFPFTAWLRYHSLELVIFSIAILLLPALKYIPRLKQMRTAGGSWRHVFLRRGFKDRL